MFLYIVVGMKIELKDKTVVWLGVSLFSGGGLLFGFECDSPGFGVGVAGRSRSESVVG